MSESNQGTNQGQAVPPTQASLSITNTLNTLAVQDQQEPPTTPLFTFSNPSLLVPPGLNPRQLTPQPSLTSMERGAPTPSLTNLSWAVPQMARSAEDSISRPSWGSQMTITSNPELREPQQRPQQLTGLQFSSNIVVNKHGKPSISQLGTELYKDLRNASTKLIRFEQNRKFLLKYLELDITPGYMARAVPILPYSRENSALKLKWQQHSNETRRGYLRILVQHDDEQIAALTRYCQEAEQKILQQIKDPNELNEIKTALKACQTKTLAAENEGRMKRLQRDMANSNAAATPNIPLEPVPSTSAPTDPRRQQGFQNGRAGPRPSSQKSTNKFPNKSTKRAQAPRQQAQRRNNARQQRAQAPRQQDNALEFLQTLLDGLKGQSNKKQRKN